MIFQCNGSRFGLNERYTSTHAPNTFLVSTGMPKLIVDNKKNILKRMTVKSKKFWP